MVSSRRSARPGTLACWAALLLVAGPLLAGDPRSALLMVEGHVSAVTVEPGEGGLWIVTAVLASREGDSRARALMLAPRLALEDIGFDVEIGDHLKARIFPGPEGPAKVHKVLNLTRRKMVRLRTLFRVPLWDGSGAWQGGECRGLQGPEQQEPEARRNPPSEEESSGAHTP